MTGGKGKEEEEGRAGYMKGRGKEGRIYRHFFSLYKEPCHVVRLQSVDPGHIFNFEIQGLGVPQMAQSLNKGTEKTYNYLTSAKSSLNNHSS